MVLIATIVLSAVLGAACVPAHAAPRPSRADLLADDPIQITDHAPRDVPADAAARIRAAVARLGVPVYLVGQPPGLPRGPEGGPTS